MKFKLFSLLLSSLTLFIISGCKSPKTKGFNNSAHQQASNSSLPTVTKTAKNNTKNP